MTEAMKSKKTSKGQQSKPTNQPKATTMPTNDQDPVWSSKTLACINTHALLVALKQLTEGFDAAGAVLMKKLAYWNPLATTEMRKLLATGIATQLDKIYTKGYWADYEQDWDFHSAIDGMAAVLIDEDKTVAHLAAIVNRIYHFRGEEDDAV
jgi:hypothetical protein